MANRYSDRGQAGRVLAEALDAYLGRPDVVVLALPRGGVPVGYEVARHLGAPLDVFVVRKLGVPGQEELAMGALASGGVRVINPEVFPLLGISEAELESIVRREEAEVQRREQLYRGGRPPPPVEGRTVILVDDGLATGTSMRAAVTALRMLHPERIVVAVPVAAASTCRELAAEVDEAVCVETPEPFLAIGLWYEDFTQTTDEEVRQLLEEASRDRAGQQPEATASP